MNGSREYSPDPDSPARGNGTLSEDMEQLSIQQPKEKTTTDAVFYTRVQTYVQNFTP